MHHVSLPRGRDREHVHYHGHDYTLGGSETRTLTSVGAFRAVPASDLRDTFDRPLDSRHGDLWHLRDSGLVETVRLGRDTTVVTLTKEGRGLLESRRLDDDSRECQAFHDGVQKLTQKVEAIYSSGVFIPTQKLGLRDEHRVRLTVEKIDEPNGDRAAVARSKAGIASMNFFLQEALPKRDDLHRCR